MFVSAEIPVENTAVFECILNMSLMSFERFLNQYKGVYEKDVKCQVKMSHNSGSVGQGPLSPSKDEVSPASAMCQCS